MLSGELARSAQKLQREQKQRSEALQRKAEREKAVQERLRKQREAHEEDLRQRRLVELAAAEAVSSRHTCTLYLPVAELVDVRLCRRIYASLHPTVYAQP